MTLPPSHPTAALQGIAERLGSNPLPHLENLRGDDFRLMSMYIQLFAFIELNLRTSITLFGHVGLIKPQVGRLAPAALTRLTSEAISKMDALHENIADSVAKLREIDSRRDFRNLFAHWAGKRVKGEDVLYSMSQDFSDMRQTEIEGIDHEHAGFAIVSLPELRNLVVHMAEYDTWLAHKANEWQIRYRNTRLP